MATNREIGAAVGILMATHNISQEQAFDLLSKASQRLNRKLRDIATGIVRGDERPRLSRRHALKWTGQRHCDMTAAGPLRTGSRYDDGAAPEGDGAVACAGAGAGRS